MISYSQTKLLSSIEQYQNGNNWENSNGFNYEYDSNDNLIIETNFYWNNSDWEPQYRDVYTYSGTNKILTETSQNYNDLSLQFETDYIGTYTYNANDNLTEVLYEEMVNSTLTNEYKINYSYTGNNVTSALDQEWNGTQWVLLDRYTATYDGNGNITQLIDEEYINGNWELYGKDVYSYDANNRIIQTEYQIWNGSAWVSDGLITYTIDANGNRLSLTETYDGSSYITTYTYDMTALMSNFANPFRDKTGTDYIAEEYPFYNKILEVNENGYLTTYNYNQALSIDEVPMLSRTTINLYPNPSSIFLNVDSNVAIETIDVYDLTGKKILQSDKNKIDISPLTDGVYAVKITNTNGTSVSKRFIKR